MRQSHIFFSSRLLRSPSNLLHLQIPQNQLLHFQVSSTFSPAFIFSIKNSFFNVKSLFFNTYPSSLKNPPSNSSPNDEPNKIHLNFALNECSSIGRSIISKCSYIWEKKDETFKPESSSLQHHLLKLSNSSPATTRRFWRVSALKPGDVLKILMGFESECQIQSRAVVNLWKLFKWAETQRRDFDHLPRSYEIMVLMLIRAGSLGEVESLLRAMEVREIVFCGREIFGKIIERYVEATELEKSVAMYDRARDRGIVLTESCYRVLLNFFIRMNKTQLAFRVYKDMIESGIELNADDHAFEFVVRMLCMDGKILDARNLIKKVIDLGIEPSRVALNEIADGYYLKNDFEDLMNFLNEHKFAPDTHVCHKIISSQCRNLGTEGAWLTVQKLEALGFTPDGITFGILISWSCREGKLKNAFVYLSEILSRCLSPDVHTYNTLISGVFQEGMGKHARDVFDDMVERGVTPDMSTFRVLLAGYCKDRKFDDVKMVVREMVDRGLISLFPSDDVLSKAFMVLGLDKLGVKVKRDNYVGLPKAEFFDCLGNGLYLDTDLEEYEKIVTGSLQDAMVPNLDLVVLNACSNDNIEAALRAKNEMVRRGEKLSLPACSELLKGLCASRFQFNKAIDLLEEMAECTSHLGQETLNLLIRAMSKKCNTYKLKLILDGMMQRKLPIENETFTALIMGFCKEQNFRELKKYWELALEDNWVPSFTDGKALVGCLCKQGLLKKVLELFDIILANHSLPISDLCNVFIKELCNAGFTGVGHILLEEVIRRGLIFDQASYNHLIRGFCKEKKFHEALRILDIVLEKKIAPCGDVCELVIPHLFRFNRLGKAMILKEFMLMKKSTPTSIYNILLKELFKLGKVGYATLQFREMLLKGLIPNNDTLEVMVEGLCKEDKLGTAKELLCIMLRKNFSLSIVGYRNLVRLMCMHGEVHEALSLKEVMWRENESSHLVGYNILIYYLFQTGSSLLVTSLLDEMLEKGMNLDQITYNFLICGYYNCKDVSKSVETLNIMIYQNLRPSNRSFKTVICYLCNHGELDKALELSRFMEFRGFTHGSVVQNTLVKCLLSNGRLSEAEHFLERMEEKGLVPDNINYDILIKQFCGYGRLNMAVDLMNLMLKKCNLPSASSYDSLILGFCTLKEYDVALDFHAEMSHRKLEPSLESWEALIQGLCAEGRTEAAERLLGLMVQTGQTPTGSMYQSVIDRHRSENNLNKAVELLQEMQRHGRMPDFKTHWSLINNLGKADNKDNSSSKGFLSQLLSQSGFPAKGSKAKDVGFIGVKERKHGRFVT